METETEAINSLYYYCKLSTAIENILPKKQILLNPIGRTNDPRENKNFVFSSINMFIEDMFLLEDRDTDITKEIRKGCKMTCFSTDYKDFFGYEYSRMWALYGDNHKGICIQLNKEKFVAENPDKIFSQLFKKINYYEFDINIPLDHRAIDYEKIKELGLKKYIKNVFRPQNIDYLFFTKNKEWESEHEYRLIYFSESTQNEYCKIENSIQNIYFGVDFDINYLPSIRHNSHGVNSYFLDFTGIRLVPKESRTTRTGTSVNSI